MSAEQVKALMRGEYVPRQPPVGHRSNSEIAFTVFGTPIGKPRMTRRDKWLKRPNVIRYREWSDAVREAAGQLPHPEAVIRLDWTAFFPPPKSWSKKRRAAAIGTLHRSPPDRDNIDKAILDSLFECDSAIAWGTVRKIWGEPARVEIKILLDRK
jgi:Holliday junction resolvase RusA-like endonuclease